MRTVAGAVTEVRERVAAACDRAGRRPEDVRIVAVTKTVEAARVGEAAAAGVEDFGENYLQELAGKRDAAPHARWHFLGRVQGNKARRIAEAADLVQTLEPGRAARRLAARAAASGRTLPALVQIDVTGERVGVAPERAEAFLDEVAGEAGLDVRGLMIVPPLGEEARPWFRRLRELRERLAEAHSGVVELSMGMSADYEDAVEEGATMVRVGTAIFGPRP